MQSREGLRASVASQVVAHIEGADGSTGHANHPPKMVQNLVRTMQAFAHLASRLPVLVAPGRHGIVSFRRNITTALQSVRPRSCGDFTKRRYLLAVLFVKTEVVANVGTIGSIRVQAVGGGRGPSFSVDGHLLPGILEVI
jgi:hypothetical protein